MLDVLGDILDSAVPAWVPASIHPSQLLGAAVVGNEMERRVRAAIRGCIEGER
jgi:hypothetical protein